MHHLLRNILNTLSDESRNLAMNHLSLPLFLQQDYHPRNYSHHRETWQKIVEGQWHFQGQSYPLSTSHYNQNRLNMKDNLLNYHHHKQDILGGALFHNVSPNRKNRRRSPWSIQQVGILCFQNSQKDMSALKMSPLFFSSDGNTATEWMSAP